MSIVKITLVGDIFPGNLPYTIGFGLASQFHEHKGKPWIKLLSYFFKDSDISFGNLESPLIKDDKKALASCFAGLSYFSCFLKEIGINIVSIANNHILEQGLYGFKTTIDLLTNMGIKCAGIYDNGLSNIEVFEVSGLRIGFAAFNAIHDLNNPNLYAEYYEENVSANIKKMNSLDLDYNIISIHWGNEYVNLPSYNQIKSARHFIDVGADIIIGHHSHVVQPVERYKNGLIFYSLGNFIFDMIWSKNVRMGVVADIILKKNKEIEYNLIPINLGSDYIPHKVKNCEEFDKLLIINKRKMTFLYTKSYKSYMQYYNMKMKLNHCLQRIMMKMFLIRNWTKLSRQTKKLVLNNIIIKLNILKSK